MKKISLTGPGTNNKETKNTEFGADGGKSSIKTSVSFSEKIQKAVQKVETKSRPKSLSRRIDKIVGRMDGKDKDELVNQTLQKHFASEELKPYQAELIKLQQHFEGAGKKMIILFDGRDASGKGGTIRRVSRYMNEKHYRVVALGKPNSQQKAEMHMKRYIEQFPRAGEIVLFDRS